nr:conjugal transfer protein TrbH [Rhizobium sp. Q54]
MFKPLFLVLALAVLSSCQSAGDGPSVGSSQISLTDAAAGMIAADLAGGLADQLGPASATAIEMEPDGSSFSVALEEALRQRGFVLVTEKTSGGSSTPRRLTYSIGEIDGQVLVRLSTSSMVLARAYTRTAAAAAPASPLSVLLIN